MRVLSIDPSGRWLGFAIFEDSFEPIDWGVIRYAKAFEVIERRVVKLVQRYKPDVILLPDLDDPASRRGTRARRIAALVEREGNSAGADVHQVPEQDVTDVFTPARAATNLERATYLAALFPTQLHDQVPPRRKPWKPIPPKMFIFGAIALGVTFFELSEAVGNERPGRQASTTEP